jgi:hypothetical protein
VLSESVPAARRPAGGKESYRPAGVEPEEISMSNTASDRSRVSASDPSEVRYFGKKHGLTDEQVLDLIKEHGNDRNTLEAAVARTRVE